MKDNKQHELTFLDGLRASFHLIFQEIIAVQGAEIGAKTKTERVLSLRDGQNRIFKLIRKHEHEADTRFVSELGDDNL